MDKKENRIITFLEETENLKSTLRYIKTKSGRQESAAEHSWRLSLFALVLTSEKNYGINTTKAIKLCIVHDLAEAITGDIDYAKIKNGTVSKKEKEREEKKAILKLKKLLTSKPGKEIFDLWSEYNEGKTKEAKFVKALDKLETLLQIIEAGCKHFDIPEIIPNYPDKAVLDFPKLKEILVELKKKLKKEFQKGKINWKKEYGEIKG